MTAAVLEQWRDHRSRFSSAWLTSMYARKKVERVDVSENHDLRRRLATLAGSQRELDEMLGDAHLLEAALATDMIVASLDEMARNRFGQASAAIAELRLIMWVNPEIPEEECRQWLQGGASIEPARQLQFRVGG
jgi:hypothetical protein